jgi:hypothetical protein
MTAAPRPPLRAPTPAGAAAKAVVRRAVAGAASPWGQLLLTIALGLAIVWPAWIGQMPLSQDHNAHLTRSWLVWEQLRAGRLVGWSNAWFAGFPVTDLYPPLGDWMVALVHVLSGFTLAWPRAYGVAFTLGFLIPAWALLRVGRALGLGPWPGLIAAALMLCDPGFTREGGWKYTVYYGVWLQPVASAMAWLAFAELAQLAERHRGAGDPSAAAVVPTEGRGRALALAGGFIALALLAHPMTLPVATVMGLALALASLWTCRQLRALRATLADTGIAVALGVALAAIWLLPMLSHRSWMASYGWLYRSLPHMAERALGGQWSGEMAPLVGYTITCGLALALWRGGVFARFAALTSLGLWLLTTIDVYWWLRLDALSEGFTHIQYQRFSIAAKPGLFLMVGVTLHAVITAGVHAAHAGVVGGVALSDAARRAAPRLGHAAAALVFVGVTLATVASVFSHDVGRLQLTHLRDDPEFERDYASYLAWMARRWEQRETFFRVAYHARRHRHYYLDAPYYTGAPAYKLGFTPGENFVHKPETEDRAALDALRVRYVVSDSPGWSPPGAGPRIASFGRISVWELHGDEREVAWLVGPGELEVVRDDPEGGEVVVRIRGAGAATRVVFGLGGYPRWELTHDGAAVEWFESPVLPDDMSGPVALQADRRAGRWRGGKAEGNDGTEPTFLTAHVGDGELRLRYRTDLPVDRRGRLVTATALAVWVLALGWPLASAGLASLAALGARLLHPALLLAGLLALAGGVAVRMGGTIMAERAWALGWVNRGWATDVAGIRSGPVKVEMLLRSAVMVPGGESGTETVTFPGVRAPATLRGWIAVTDRAVRRSERLGHHSLRLDARLAGTDDPWREVTTLDVVDELRELPIAVAMEDWTGEVIDLRVVVRSWGESPPRLAFDLELGLPVRVEPMRTRDEGPSRGD